MLRISRVGHHSGGLLCAVGKQIPELLFAEASQGTRRRGSAQGATDAEGQVIPGAQFVPTQGLGGATANVVTQNHRSQEVLPAGVLPLRHGRAAGLRRSLDESRRSHWSRRSRRSAPASHWLGQR